MQYKLYPKDRVKGTCNNCFEKELNVQNLLCVYYIELKVGRISCIVYLCKMNYNFHIGKIK